MKFTFAKKLLVNFFAGGIILCGTIIVAAYGAGFFIREEPIMGFIVSAVAFELYRRLTNWAQTLVK